MPLTRQDRIALRKKQTGAISQEPSMQDLDENIPVLSNTVDPNTGLFKTTQWVKSGGNLFKSDLVNNNKEESDYSANWLLSDIMTIGGLTSLPSSQSVYRIPANTFIVDIRILVSTSITGGGSGNADIDVGDGTNTDMFINGWTCAAGTVSEGTIIAFGRAENAPDSMTGHKTGLYYSSEDTLDIRVNDSPSAGAIRLLILEVRNPQFASRVNPDGMRY